MFHVKQRGRVVHVFAAAGRTVANNTCIQIGKR